jgi:hypothetical protein
MNRFICFAIAILISRNLHAQQVFSVAGNIKNEKGENLESATAFIDGTNNITQTNLYGNYTIKNLPSGTYTIVISMVGHSTERKMVLLRDKQATANFVLKQKPIALNEVLIGTDSHRPEILKLFTDKFLGVTENARSCKIINPQIIEFTTNKSVLLATTPDFLIIENPNLGYRIKYLLKVFRYDKTQHIASYTGDCIFEELTGSDKQQKRWQKNRLAAYKGSFMHYLRTLYAGNSTQEGFKSYVFLTPWPVPQSTINNKVAELTKKGIDSKAIIDSVNKLTRPNIKEEPEDMRKYVTRMDSSFVKIAFKPTLNVVYNKTRVLFKKAAKGGNKQLSSNILNSLPTDIPKAGVVTLYLDYTIVDRYGNYFDYRSFLREGSWNYEQIGDRLPFTYQPPFEPDLIVIQDK